LKRDLFCLDINRGCAGFVVGLIQAFMMLEQDSITRVAVANADVISREVSPKDRNLYPLIESWRQSESVELLYYADITA